MLYVYIYMVYGPNSMVHLVLQVSVVGADGEERWCRPGSTSA